MMDLKTLSLVGGVLVLLGAAAAVVHVLKRRTDSGIDPAIVETFRLRLRAWALLFAVLAATFVIGSAATVVLFWAISFWALREFITLTPTRPGDHRALFWVFFLCTPLQFFLVGMRWYGLYSILIPVYAFLLIPARIAIAGDAKRFLERTAKIQCGLLICVYCLSYAPALMTLRLPGRPAEASTAADIGDGVMLGAQAPGRVSRSAAAAAADPGQNARLLFFFVFIVQLSDAFQYAWSHLPVRHVIAPAISPTRTWEGVLGGAATAALVGGALWWATPFPVWMAALMSLVIAVMGFAGSMTMSAIKRDRGVRDYGTLVAGHGGVLDRIDSICFAAPVFFHCTRFYLNMAESINPLA
ncbi:MAG TPA: phosphatidate cytidylyltransferase [Planctomycetaceae bacterium]|nr:phosphatidate cytidylyltransferase [Planctomycetaceae bacterium]